MSSLQAVSSASLFNSNLYANGIPPAQATPQAATAPTAAAATPSLPGITTNFLTSAVTLATDTNFQLQLLAQDGNLFAQEVLAERTAASKFLNPGSVNLLA